MAVQAVTVEGSMKTHAEFGRLIYSSLEFDNHAVNDAVWDAFV